MCVLSRVKATKRNERQKKKSNILYTTSLDLKYLGERRLKSKKEEKGNKKTAVESDPHLLLSVNKRTKKAPKKKKRRKNPSPRIAKQLPRAAHPRAC